jgi:signal transduction histidine kinase
MRRYASEVFDNLDISCTMHSDNDITHRKLNMEQRRDLYLLFKEIINNICKHAQATHVDIRVSMEKNKLHLYIADNGVGFDTTAPTHRNGINGLHTRVRKWKGQIDIRSGAGDGTQVHIALPS